MTRRAPVDPSATTALGARTSPTPARRSVEALLMFPGRREAFDLEAEPDAVRDRYGRTRFGQSCLLARRLVERGVRFVTVNMFETVFNEITWDIHGSAPFSPIECYRNEVGPSFDNAYSTLLEDLDAPGLLDNTMVLAFGEFGRTPRINPAGGRDHHPGCWTALSRAARSRAAGSSAPPTRSARPPRTAPSPPPRSPRRSTGASASAPTSTLPGPRAAHPGRRQGVEPIGELSDSPPAGTGGPGDPAPSVAERARS